MTVGWNRREVSAWGTLHNPCPRRIAGWILFSAILVFPFRAYGENIRVLRGIEHRMAGQDFRLGIYADPQVPEYRLLNYTEDSFRRIVLDFPGKWKISGPYKYEIDHDWVLGIRLWAHPDFLRVVVDLSDIEVSPPESETVENGVVLRIRKAGEGKKATPPPVVEDVMEVEAVMESKASKMAEPESAESAVSMAPAKPETEAKAVPPRQADGRMDKARSFFDFGVFAFEEGDFESAEKYFMSALELKPDNPYGLHYMAKIRMKKKRYPDALKYLEDAWNTNPDIPGLKYDLALTRYKMGKYETAADLFTELVEDNPDGILANYYAGICLFHLERCGTAQKYFLRAAQKKSDLRADCRYIAGICGYKSGSFEKALEMFKSVIDDPESGKLKEKARKWTVAVKKAQKTRKPWRLSVKTGIRYDDNARLEPSDRDTGREPGDYSMHAATFGRYTFLHQNPVNFGIGANYNQTWYDRNDEFEISSGALRLFTRYAAPPYTFRFAYKPSFVRLDSERYSEEHRLNAEIWRRITQNMNARLSYEFAAIENFSDHGKTGDSNSVFLDADYSFFDRNGKLSAGLGLVRLDASDPEESFQQLIAKLGLWLRLPLAADLELAGEFNDRKYDRDASGLCVERDDDRYSLKVALSRPFIEEWIRISAQYEYVLNDSNFVAKQYDKNRVMFSMEANY